MTKANGRRTVVPVSDRAHSSGPNRLPSRAFGSVGASAARHLAEPATRARCETRVHFGTFTSNLITASCSGAQTDPVRLLAHPPGAVTGTARTALLRFRSAIA